MTTTHGSIKVLIVEDDYEDYLLTRDLLLQSSPAYEVTWARDFDAGKRALESTAHDVCLIDYHLGHRDGMELIYSHNAGAVSTPMILLTGEQESDVGLKASAAGAADFLSKNDVSADRLDRAIRYSIEREKAAMRRRESAALLSAALNALLGRIAILDENGIIIAVNASWQRLASQSFASSVWPGVGENYLDVRLNLVPPAAGENISSDAVIREVMSGSRDSGQAEHLCREGHSDRFFDMRVTRFFEEGMLRLVVSHIDMTERKALEEDARRLAAIVEHSAEAIIGLNLDGRVTSWNAAAERLFGYTAGEMLGQNIARLDPAKGRAVIADILQRVRNGEAVEERESEVKAPTGGTLIVSGVFSPVYDAVGRVTGASRIVRDITHQKNLEQQLLHSQRIEAIGQLTGGIAHDFNNILTVINGHAETLKRKTRPDDPRYLELSEIAAAGGRAAKLIQQLLAFGRKQIFKVEKVDLNRVIVQLKPMLDRLLRENITLHLSLTPGLPCIEIDVNRMEQVLVNLVINAGDAMPRGGHLYIETCAEPCDSHGMKSMDGGPSGKCVKVTVRDTGTGIPPDVLGKVFEPFFTTKPVGKGTGLGLSTVYGIVKQSGGHISIESEMDKGTTVRISLPASAGSPAFREPNTLEAPADEPNAGLESGGVEATVMLVEDDPSVREYAVGVLAGPEYRIVEAADGKEALNLARTCGNIDILITDLTLPGIGGQALADLLTRTHPSLKVLFLSGYEKIPLQSGRELLVKPFGPSALRSRVRKLLACRAAQSGLIRRASHG